MDNAFASEDHRLVVVGVNGTATGTATVGLAAAEAARRSARLLIVHVWPGSYRGRFRIRGAHRGEEEGGHLLALAAHHAGVTAPGLTVETQLRVGIAGDTLADFSRHAALVVVGHRDDDLGYPEWGSTTRSLARSCACPLLVRRGRADDRGPVVVGVSGRPAEPALGYAFLQAELTGAGLVAVHAWRLPPAGQDRHPLPLAARDPARREATETLDAALVDWSWRLPHVGVERLVVPDRDVGYTVDRASRRARLLVAGFGGRGGLTDMIRDPAGRTASPHHACPVLLVPPGWPVRPPAAPSTAEARSPW
jgi:nucleotide-binding universal stress UspA family protein